MPLFFIEMGQGIIALPDLRVCTSALYSCTLIAGFNARSGYGGAYHYPSGDVARADIAADMDVWRAILRPTHVTLVFAPDPAGNGVMGTSPDERIALQNWVTHRCGVVPTVTNAVAAGMSLTAAGFDAGGVGGLAGNFERAGAIGLQVRDAGRYLDYGGLTLVGENREG